MENKNIIVLKHHPMNIKFTNSYYTHQVDDNLEDYVVIDVTSRVKYDKEFMKNHVNFEKEISPFYVGPVETSDGLTCQVFEHFWQASKVYPCHYIKGELTPDFFVWRKSWFDKPTVSSKKLTRHPNEELGYKPQDCLFSVVYKKGEYCHLDYIESRKEMYFPEYVKCIVQSESFKELKSLVDRGQKVALVDFDGYNYYSEKGMDKRYEMFKKKNPTSPITRDDFKKIKSMKDVVNCPFLACGHGFVLKALLEEDIVVIDNQVIDKSGILE